MKNPTAGDVIPDAGGLRKLRFGDARRGKGKRSGLRVLYYWWDSGLQFWLFTFVNSRPNGASDLRPNGASSKCRFCGFEQVPF
jgi:hypothetical protein